MEKIEHRQENIRRFEDFENVNIFNQYYLVLYPLNQSLIYSTQKYTFGKVLDIGCGNKPYEKLFSQCISYLGCDIVQSSGKKVDIICEANNIPLEKDSINTILCTQVIEHVADFKGMLAEAYRILMEGGCFILSGPMYWHIHEAPHDYYRFTKHGFKYILEDVGFGVIEIIPNGGKWALFGQMVIHSFPQWIVGKNWSRKIINRFFHKLDNKHFDDTNTMNYTIIAQK